PNNPLPVVPEPRRGYFRCAAHLLPPGVLHNLCFFPLWLPTGLLSTQLRGRGPPDCLCGKPRGHPRTSELATDFFQPVPELQISKAKASRNIFQRDRKKTSPFWASETQDPPSLTI
ncbi:unnamed protein product, partial [Gulo gulo]